MPANAPVLECRDLRKRYGERTVLGPLSGALGQGGADEPLSESQEEERHWEETFDEFLRVREECGEASDGLTFDRFRVKLQKNKDTLVEKYGCRTVRFQVYVKEGKAALKATPVK